MKKTILYDIHISLGAKMAPFGGYLMPIQYDGIIKEHFAVRKDAAIFDTCHMGEFLIEGDSVVEDLEHILSCWVFSIQIHQCRYGLMCNENGGVIDDFVLYRLSERKFLMVVNAATQQSDLEWIRHHLSPSTVITDISDETAKIDLQGPLSAKIMRKLMELPIDEMKYYWSMSNRYRGKDVLISRTGYTGELGFEIYCDAQTAIAFWNNCRELGAFPAGLGARDTLRLEMGLPLYGHELLEDRNAAESGLDKYIAKGKKFIGSSAILNPENKRQTLVGLLLDGRRAARAANLIVNSSGIAVGVVTSGSFAPSLGRAIALAYVDNPFSIQGECLYVLADNTKLKAVVTELPFYKFATARSKLELFL